MIFACFTGRVGVEMQGWAMQFNFNTLRLGQNGRHFPEDNFKRIFFNENVWILIKISLKFVLNGLINNIPALVQVMAWRRSGDKPLAEPMVVRLPMHICVTRPQWVKSFWVGGKSVLLFLQLLKNNHCIHGLVQDCSNSIADALELLLFCIKSLVFTWLSQNIPISWVLLWKRHITCNLSHSNTFWILWQIDGILPKGLYLPWPFWQDTLEIMSDFVFSTVPAECQALVGGRC